MVFLIDTDNNDNDSHNTDTNDIKNKPLWFDKK